MTEMGFMFYDSYYDAAQALPVEQQGEFYRLLVEYAVAGTEPECDGALRLGFELARPNLDKSVARSRAGAKGGSSTSDAKRSAVRANGAKGGRPAQTSPEPKQNLSKTKAKPKQKPKQGEGRGGKRRGVVNKAAPTLEDVRAYVKDKGYSFDPDAFFAYYDSQGWKKANGQRVANWRQCCVTWERNRKGASDDGFKVYDRAGEMHTLWEALDA